MNNDIKHIWSIACKKGLIESNTNIISLIEILEKVDIKLLDNAKFSEERPAMIPLTFELISHWQKLSKTDIAKGEGKVLIYSPKNKYLGGATINFEVPENLKTTRTIVKINGLPIVGSGDYKIEIQQKMGKEYVTVAEIPLEVEVHIKKGAK